MVAVAAAFVLDASVAAGGHAHVATAGHASVDAGLVATILVMAAAAGYWWRVSRPRTATESRQRVWGIAGWVCCAFVLITPIHALAEQSVAWHMAQHLVLMMVAAPLLAAA